MEPRQQTGGREAERLPEAARPGLATPSHPLHSPPQPRDTHLRRQHEMAAVQELRHQNLTPEEDPGRQRQKRQREEQSWQPQSGPQSQHYWRP